MVQPPASHAKGHGDRVLLPVGDCTRVGREVSNGDGAGRTPGEGCRAGSEADPEEGGSAGQGQTAESGGEPDRARGRRALLEERRRVDVPSVPAHLEVQMRAGGQARATDVADDIALVDARAVTHGDT